MNEKIGDYLLSVGERGRAIGTNIETVKCYKVFNEATGVLELETSYLHAAYKYIYDGLVQTQGWKSAAQEVHEQQTGSMMLPDADMLIPDVDSPYGPQ